MRYPKFLSQVLTTAMACALATVGFVVVSATPGSAATKAPIPVGYICSCTSPLGSSILVNRASYEAFVDYTNVHGGVDGHKIRLYVSDDGDNPSTSAAQVHTFVTQDHIVALASVSNSPQAWDTYLEGLHIPVVGTDGSAEDMFTQPDFFFPGQTDDSLPAAVALAAKKAGDKTFGVFYCAESPACQELLNPLKKVGSQYGVTLSYVAEISASAPSYAAQCLAAKQAGVKALFIGDAVSVVEAVATDCNQQGYDPTIIASDGAVGEGFEKTPGLDNNLLAFEPQIPFNVTNTPATRAMISAFKTYEPGLTSNPNYNGEVVEAWTSGLLLAAGIESGKPGAKITSAEILKGLDSLKGETLGGMSPPLTYHRGKPNTTDCWFWMTTHNGKFTEKYGLTPACATK
jgi:branched-chain amino acid transport system substrate-binding protein